MFVQGLFSRITFNQPVFVGGSGSTKNVKSFLGVDSGLHGCVRHLEINDKLYNLQPVVKGGDVQQGLDISKFLKQAGFFLLRLDFITPHSH